MTSRDGVLDAMQALILANRSSPSIQEIARAVGLTKQGVLHYFPTRVALDSALAARALSRVEAQMREAARDGSPTETYLRLSAPTQGDRAAAFIALASLASGVPSAIVGEAFQAVTRWQALIAEELGDPVLAEIARLAGDGLFSQALVTGVDPSSDEIDRLVAGLIDRRVP